MYRDPGAWDALMERLVDATALYLNAQAEAGAQALQVFDSWVGNLGPDDYRRFVQPHMPRLFDRLGPGVPVIHFGTDTGSLLELQRDAGGHVIGLDWRVELDAGLGAARPGRRRPGEPRPGGPLRPDPRDRAPGAADPRRGGGPARPHLQPRPRHPPPHPGRSRPGARRHGPHPPQPVVEAIRDVLPRNRRKLRRLSDGGYDRVPRELRRSANMAILSVLRNFLSWNGFFPDRSGARPGLLVPPRTRSSCLGKVIRPHGHQDTPRTPWLMGGILGNPVSVKSCNFRTHS